MIRLKIIIASTRPGRKGPSIAAWVYEAAQLQKDFEVELVDLGLINLPFLDEPNHPRLKKYEKQHTRDWSAKIDSADAFIFVTCEYNHGYPATLKNALDFLFHEWNYKPVGFVSYGGISGGIRSVQLLKPVVTGLKMMPLMESVHIPFFNRQISPENKFIPIDTQENEILIMFGEIKKWSHSLSIIRNDQGVN